MTLAPIMVLYIPLAKCWFQRATQLCNYTATCRIYSCRRRVGHRLNADTKNVAPTTFIVAQETKNVVGLKPTSRFYPTKRSHIVATLFCFVASIYPCYVSKSAFFSVKTSAIVMSTHGYNSMATEVALLTAYLEPQTTTNPIKSWLSQLVTSWICRKKHIILDLTTRQTVSISS